MCFIVLEIHCELFIKAEVKALNYNIRSLYQVLRDQRTQLRKIFDVRSIQTNGATVGKERRVSNTGRGRRRMQLNQPASYIYWADSLALLLCDVHVFRLLHKQPMSEEHFLKF